MMSTLVKVAKGVYRYGDWKITRVARDHWSVTSKKGHSHDFVSLADAKYFLDNEESLYPKSSTGDNHAP